MPVGEEIINALEHDERLDRGAVVLDRVNARFSGPVQSALRGDWLGHALHPALTDLPIGCFVSAAVLDTAGGRGSRRAAQRLVGLGLIAALPTAASGIVDAAMLRKPSKRRVAVPHAVGNSIALLAYHRSWRARRRGHHVRGVVLGSVGAGLLVVTAYLGGHLAFAADSGDALDDTGSGAASDGGRAQETDGSLLDERRAREMLGVPPEQFEAMVDQGLLPSVGPRQFRESDVMAVRLAGA